MINKYLNRIDRIKTLKQLNVLEIELIENYWLLFTKNNFLEKIKEKRCLFYNEC